uniref:C-type lectin domain-containing protein n=1 Tax=Caenorhabditis tropicalis TaxID=1561998 RepID=A0A1I7U1F2_9PELO
MKLLVFLAGITVVSGIIAPGYGGFGGGSSSSSSEEHRRPHHHHHHHHHHERSSEEEATPPPPATCPVNWMSFNRPQGTWCVKVFFTSGVNRDSAEQLCKAQGATLTGVQDASENMQIANDARNVYNQYRQGQGEVWLGASRKPNCPLRQSCAPLQTFDWTDGHTTGTAGFIWGPTEPNGIIFANWGQENCINQLISGCCATGKFGYPHGSMDDSHCQNSFNLYACGKRPS